MITKKQVQHIAKLARIALTGEEVVKFQKELGAILEYVEKLNEVNTDNVEPLYQVTGKKNALRGDEQNKEKTNRDLLLDQTHIRDRDFIKVRSVFDK